MSKSSRWLSFQQAREFARTLQLTSQKGYEAWARVNGRQHRMPVSPHKFYDEFTDYPDFLNFTATPRQKKTNRSNVLPFAEARVYMQQFALKSQREFDAWSRKQRPAFIPSSPRDFYGAEFTSMDDFLGYKKSYRPFAEARDFARSKNFQCRRDWLSFATTTDFPKDIPIHPKGAYNDQGWDGWPDFLGYYSRWNRLSIVAFLNSLKPVIADLSELDLYWILSKNGMLHRRLGLRGDKILRGLSKLKTPEAIEAAKEQFASEIETAESGDEGGLESETINGAAITDFAGIDPSSMDLGPESMLRQFKLLKSLSTLDQLVEARITDDPEIIEEIINGRVNQLWQLAMDDEVSVITQVKELQGGPYLGEVQKRFLLEYEQVMRIALPPGYVFSDFEGKVLRPNLMQLLTAHRLSVRKRLGNWSGVGAGKTKAAVLSAGVLNSQLTVIVAANSTVEEWELQIRQVFADERCAIQLKNPRDFELTAGKLNFLVLNYELFQQTKSEDVFKAFGEKHKINFLVLDEVQLAKQRHEETDVESGQEKTGRSRVSKRRRVVEELIRNAIVKNPECRVLAMSATPVINNLREAVKTLELIHPEEDYSAVPIGSSVPNAINVHLLLRQNGIRHCPQYDIELVKTPVHLDGLELLRDLQGLQAKDILLMEQTLLRVKLKHLHRWVKRGTLIYTQYVDGIVAPVKQVIEAMGLKVQEFTGGSRVGIGQFVEDFRAGRVDVLVGSQPVGTGVDRLQYVLNQIVFVTLPWSNAEYQQIVGRLRRQKSEFARVDVIIPQVVLREERAGIWSWDDQRLRCIEYKRTLADAVLDGTIPLGDLCTKDEMQRRSLEALQVWVNNVAQ